MMPTFVRRLDPKIDALLASPLYDDHLLKDIRETGDVFPAIRNNRLDFYHGGKLFSFGSSGFITHYKYIPGITEMAAGDYLPDSKLGAYQLPATFVQGYDRIKELCRVYAGEEAWYVSRLYRHFRELFSPSSQPTVIPLDIEICFHADGEHGKRKLDRIDILFFNTKSRTLRFGEVKRFSDSRLYASDQNVPEVVGQLTRYQKQIAFRADEITMAYQDYVMALNRLFKLQIPRPIGIDEKPIFLLITGFDDEQRKRVVEDMKVDLHTDHGVTCYAIGNIVGCKLPTMWKAI